MDRLESGIRASERILARKETLAAGITEALYERNPSLLERYGVAGREKCLQDMRYNLEHLAPAVDLGDPSLFARYVRWLEGLLRARNVSSADVIDSLHETGRVIRATFPADEARAVEPSIRAGLAEIGGAGNR
jgi:hypothetical protein